MPLLDLFHPPLNRTHPWRSFHGAWAASIARQLNQGVLPSCHFAVPLVGVEVWVFADDGHPRLAAAIELLSPRTQPLPRSSAAVEG